MNIQEYIESGILEQYALGLLNERESTEVLRNAQKHPEIREQIDAFEDALLKYAQANAMPLREGVSTRILNAIDALILKSSGGIANTGRIAMFLLGIAAIIASGLAFFANQQRTTLQAQLNNAETQFQILERDCNENSAQIQALNTKLNTLRTAGNETTSMNALQDVDDGIIAFIHRDQDTKAAYLDVANLPSPPKGKQYQLWYIADTIPQSMGVFDLTEDFIPVDFIDEAVVFAISLEDEGGSPTPTDIRFLGNVG